MPNDWEQYRTVENYIHSVTVGSVQCNRLIGNYHKRLYLDFDNYCCIPNLYSVKNIE